MANNMTKIIAGLLIAIAVLLGIYAWMLGRGPAQPAIAAAPQATAAKAVPMVVAARLLPAGQPITADALKVEQTPVLPTGAFSDPAALVGRLPASDIMAASPVLAAALTSGLADLVAPGERAVAVKVDETNAVGNRLRPGNFVDVFMNLKREGGGSGLSGAEISRSQARLLLSKVRVLSFGDATPDHDGVSGPTGGARTVVLSVPTAQVDALTLAEASGRLTIALRNPHDDETAAQTVAMRAANGLAPSAVAAAGVLLDELAASRAGLPRDVRAPRPAVPAKRGGGIEVIRGGRVETVAY